MFTGIVETTAAVIEYSEGKLTLERPAIFNDIVIGSSIAVSGVCLSVVEMNNTSMSFDVIEETLQKTTIGNLKQNDRVNLERSMKADARLDGHIVQGHVEGVGLIKEFRIQNSELTMEAPSDISKNIVPKGSIAIDGVSLTVVNRDGNLCTVALIPHTLKITTLGNLKAGDHVNIETDILYRSHPVHS